MQPNTPIAVTLTALEWNAVMQFLGTHPFKDVVQYIQSIQAQCMQYEMNGLRGQQSVSGQDAES